MKHCAFIKTCGSIPSVLNKNDKFYKTEQLCDKYQQINMEFI